MSYVSAKLGCNCQKEGGARGSILVGRFRTERRGGSCPLPTSPVTPGPNLSKHQRSIFFLGSLLGHSTHRRWYSRPDIVSRWRRGRQCKMQGSSGHRGLCIMNSTVHHPAFSTHPGLLRHNSPPACADADTTSCTQRDD